MAVFVLGKRKRPLMPCSEKRARLLLQRGRAVVVRLHPFTIRLKDRIGGARQSLRLKLDPGSRTTGLALVREDAAGATVLWLGELTHRGAAIRAALTARRGHRRRRRSANLRHRAPRFDNRRRPAGWLAPSLRHRVATTAAWVARLRRLAPITALSQEVVRFDTQAIEDPTIEGVGYQQGELAGFERREYVLLRGGHRCAYCGADGVPLEVEHVVARSRGGSNRVSNLVPACVPCNQAKGNASVEDFLAVRPAVLAAVTAQLQRPLADTAAVNSTRWALYEHLTATGLPVTAGSGGRTKWNRTRLGVPKTHALDAACVGPVDALHGWAVPTLAIRCTGRGNYQRTRLNGYGFPRGHLTRRKRIHGFQTGDRVVATIPTGTKMGMHVGRVAVRATGSFNIQTPAGVVQGISHRHCRLLQRADGYGYSFNPTSTEVASRAA